MRDRRHAALLLVDRLPHRHCRVAAAAAIGGLSKESIARAPPGVADEGGGDAKNGCSKAANRRENTIVKVTN